MNAVAAEWSVSRRTVAWSVALACAVAFAYVAVAIPPLVLFAVPAMFVLGLVIIRWPVVAVIGLIASVPIQQFGAIGPLTVTRAFVPLAIGATLILLTIARRPVVVSWLALPFAAMLCWMIVSAQSARSTSMAEAEIFRWTIAFLAFVIAVQFFVGAPQRVVVTIVTTIAVVAALQASAGILQSALALGPESFQVAGRLSRAYGTFGRPNTFAGYLEMAFFPVLWLAIFQMRQQLLAMSRYRVRRMAGFVPSSAARHELVSRSISALILVGCSAVILAGVAFSFSRGAWLGVTVGLIVTFTVALRRFWLPAVAMAPLAVLLLVFVSAATPDALAGRLSSISAEARPFDASSATIDEDNFATVERMAHWQAGLAMFRDHPISGVGPGNYNVMYPDYFVRTDFRISQGHAHNYYVHALAETGAVGLLLYVLLLVVFLVLALRVSLRETGIAQAIALGALGTTTAVMVHNVFENLHVLNLGVQISATWALALAAYRSSRPNRKSVGVDVE